MSEAAPKPSGRRGELAAGRFSSWLDDALAALDGAESSVPCGGCTACCRSSQFVTVEADEHETRAAIPSELLFPAPRRPGSFVLGHDRSGRCPLLGAEGCSIYEQRPRACRSYDCRVLAAAGVAVGDDQPALGAQVERWRFERADLDDETLLEAVRSAASYLADHPEVMGTDSSQVPTAVALAALRTHRLFLSPETPEQARPSPEAVAVALRPRAADG